MVDKIIGLDIGEDAIKAILVARGFRGGYRAIDAAAVAVDKTGGVGDALKTLFQNRNLRGCPCVTALSVEDLSFRNMVLPFRNDGKIRQILPFELEPMLHFAVKDAVLDFIQVGEGTHSDILVAAAPKKAVEERTAQLSEYVKRISHVNVESAAVAAVLHARSPSTGCFLLLDIGAGHSTGLLVRSGRLCQIRPFAFGGKRITETIARILEIDTDEAEKRKRESRIAHAQEAVDALFEAFFAEVDQTMEFARLQGRLPCDPDRIYVTGGGALYAPLRDAMSRHFSAPVEPVNLLADHAVPADQAVSSRPPLIMNQALALAVAGHKKGLGFSIGMKPPGLKTALVQHRGALRAAAVVLLLMLILAGTDIYLDHRYNRQRLNTLNAEITSLYKSLNPEASRMVDPVSQLKGKILEAGKATQGISEPRAGTTVSALLKEISILAPPAAELTLHSLTLDTDALLLKGQAINAPAVNAFKNHLMKSDFFRTVELSGADPARQGDKVDFDMRVTLRR